MLGKLSSLVSYWKVLEVYTLKRFPSNKLPMFGMVFTYLWLTYTFYATMRDNRTAQLKLQRIKRESRSLQEWAFNDSAEACKWTWK